LPATVDLFDMFEFQRAAAGLPGAEVTLICRLCARWPGRSGQVNIRPTAVMTPRMRASASSLMVSGMGSTPERPLLSGP